jgi:hypothetical protein
MASANKKQMEQQEKDLNFIKKLLSILWTIITFIASVIVKIIVGIYVLIKSIAFSVSALVAAFSLLIIAGALSVYLISMGLGLKESPTFSEWREEIIQEHRLIYEEKQQRYGKKEPRASEDYTVAEVTEQSCTTDADCEVPNEYAIRSICPYTSKCINNKCTVVCPAPFGLPQ